MEDFFDFLPALLIFWVVLRALRGRKGRRPKQATGPQGSLPAQPRAPGFTGFEELVRRLEAAAAEAAQQNAPQPAAPPALVPTARAIRAGVDEEEAFEALDARFDPAGEFHFVGGPGEGRQATEFHETHSLEHGARPSSHMPSLDMPSLDMPSAHLGQPIGSQMSTLHPLVVRLRTVATAREALILKDVLGPPRSHRRQR